MTIQHSIEDFAENLREDVQAFAESNEQEMMLPDTFTQMVFDLLSESGEFDDPMVCYHRSRGMEVSGYAVDEDEARVDLFVSIHTKSVPPVTVTKDQVETAFRRLRSFLEWSLSGRHVELEESSPVFDMAAHIHASRRSLARARLCVITDGKTTVERVPPDESIGGIAITNSLWDIVRLHRLSTSGVQREAIAVDLRERFGGPLPCLQAHTTDEGYRAFLMLIPGELLRSIYADFGPRLLETNVRSFLQARAKVNRGIRDTILDRPARFLAYNNGITLTAETVELCDVGGTQAIERLTGLQIVNGGQTTATMLSAQRGRADLSEVYVAAKLIEIEQGEIQAEMVRDVSRYANSQNRISEADFSANDPFHRRIEELSRTIWAPPVGRSQGQTRWFYERARGQYQEAKTSEPTPSRRRAFALENPTAQRFSKTDFAKFEGTWDQFPHIVSRGAQKNFSDFVIRSAERDLSTIEPTQFHRLVAKAILFRTAERIVQRQGFGGYRANIVTYTLALLSHATSQRIDLAMIWREQDLAENLQRVIAELSHDVYRIITNPPDAQNITEWCKDERCWDVVRASSPLVPLERIETELLDREGIGKGQKDDVSKMPPEYVGNLKRVVGVNSEGWRMLANWGAETGALDPSQRQLALQIGKSVQRGKSIGRKDAERAVEVLDLAAERGFSVETNEEARISN